MKLTPLGEKLAIYDSILLLSIAGIVISALSGWGIAVFVCIAVGLVSFVRSWDIGKEADLAKYGFFGLRRGPDILHKYEPGDEEYEGEKIFYDDDDDVTIDVDVEVKEDDEDREDGEVGR